MLCSCLLLEICQKPTNVASRLERLPKKDNVGKTRGCSAQTGRVHIMPSLLFHILSTSPYRHGIASETIMTPKMASLSPKSSYNTRMFPRLRQHIQKPRLSRLCVSGEKSDELAVVYSSMVDRSLPVLTLGAFGMD
jgi:hypothetical protein